VGLCLLGPCFMDWYGHEDTYSMARICSIDRREERALCWMVEGWIFCAKSTHSLAIDLT
jgi:hypothetical protein